MACGDQSRKYLEFTGPLMQKYAQKCDVDFHIVYQEDETYPTAGYQKWAYKDLLKMYDRVLHIDADMVVRESTPNLFEKVPYFHFGGVDELPFQNLDKENPPVDRKEDVRRSGHIYVNYYINVGLYLFSKEHKHLFEWVKHPVKCHFGEQSTLNYDLHSWGKSVFLLSPQFNFMKLMEDAGLSKDSAHIIHYAGNWGGLSSDQVLEMMKKDYAAKK